MPRIISDTASGLILGKKFLELNVLVSKFARQDGVSYVHVEDWKGKISPGVQRTQPERLPRAATAAPQIEAISLPPKLGHLPSSIAAAKTSQPEECMIKAGDTLSKLAERFYGAQWKGNTLYRDTIKNPWI